MKTGSARPAASRVLRNRHFAVGDAFKKVIVARDRVPAHYDGDGVLIIGLLDFLSDPGSLET